MVVFFMVAATSNSAHFRLIHLPSSLSILDVHLRPFTRFFFSLPWASKFSLVGAHIFILIDTAKVQNKKMQNKHFSNLFQIYFKC